jgi:group I intron endonuclease
MIGIYKWVSPNNRVYIGQSKDLEQRKQWYLSNGINKASMPKLKNSFNKYGIENHKFEIIEECFIEQLNEREIFWGLYYNTLEEGLNCKLGEQNCIFSENTKKLMSSRKKNIPQSLEHKIKRMQILKEIWKIKTETPKPLKKPKSKTNSNSNSNMTTGEKISLSKKGKPIHTEESKQKLREFGKTRSWMKDLHLFSIQSLSHPILQYDKNMEFIKEFPSGNAAERELRGKDGDNIMACVRGRQKTAYGFIWKLKE